MQQPHDALMRAAVLTGPRQLSVLEVARPRPGPGQVRIRLEGCGVCASNLTPWAGPQWMQFPTGALGHVAWGIIDEMHDVGEGLAIGDRVAALTYTPRGLSKPW
jgi:threonine dehydrogenase-like Zn-dependent dehydrogenase